MLCTFLSLLLTALEMKAPCPTRNVYTFPEKPTFLENIAVRRNGSLLLTSLNYPGGLHSLNPFDGSEPIPLISQFPGVNSTLGIVETEEDVFYILGSNFSLTPPLGTQPGSNALFRVDLSKHDEKAEAELVLNLPEVQFVNGLTKFNNTLLFAADSKLGAVWAINLLQSPVDYSILARDVLMAPQGEGLAEGINGVQYNEKNGMLYFTNSNQRLFAKLPLSNDGNPLGSAVFITHSITQDGVDVPWDDFALDGMGNAYVATEQGNGIQKVDAHGNVEIIAGELNSTLIAQPTSAKFGRTWRDRGVLYVTTGGGRGVPVVENGEEIVVGAQVVAVDVEHCRWKGHGWEESEKGGWWKDFEG